MATLGTVTDRVAALVTAQGYGRTTDAFDFDFQPDTKLDRVFHVRAARKGTEGLLGGDQTETVEFTVYLALRTRRDASGAQRQLLVDMALLEASFYGDESDEAQGYYIPEDGVQFEAQPPPHEGDFVVGRFVVLTEFDHLM